MTTQAAQTDDSGGGFGTDTPDDPPPSTSPRDNGPLGWEAWNWTLIMAVVLTLIALAIVVWAVRRVTAPK